MPPYPGVANATIPAYVVPQQAPRGIQANDSIYLWGVQASADKSVPLSDVNVAGETPTPPAASIAACMSPEPGLNEALIALSVELRFSGAPGAFSVQVQEADTDADAFYATPAGANFTVTAVSGNNIARTDIAGFNGKFCRILIASRTNAVAMTAKLTRTA